MIFIVGSDLIRAEKSDTGTNWRTVNRKRRLDGSWAELAFILWTVQRSISWPPQSVCGLMKQCYAAARRVGGADAIPG